MFVCNVRCPMDFSSQRIASFQSVDAITHLYFVCCAETRAMDTFFPQMPTSRSGTPDRRWIFLSAIEQRIQNLPDPKLTLLSSEIFTSPASVSWCRVRGILFSGKEKYCPWRECTLRYSTDTGQYFDAAGGQKTRTPHPIT